jgi:hypothetical protein
MYIEFRCNNPDCDNHIKKYFKSAEDIPPFLDCGADDCGTGKLERTLGAPSSKSTQFLDNGMQARRVEVMSAVIEKETDKLDEE